MNTAIPKSNNLRSENIVLCVSPDQKALLDQAAEVLGRSRNDFIVETACREAESVLLDQVDFDMDEEAFEDFAAMLDAPPKPNPRLARLLKTKTPWDK